MKRAILLLCLLPLSALCEIPPGYAERMANAIKLAENSHVHPYGVMLRSCRFDEIKSRRVCLNTIRHQYRDWEADGRQGDFITYIADSYAPFGVSNDPHNLNANWQRNVRSLLK